MIKIIKPDRINKGDLIGIISPASSVNDPTLIPSGVEYLEKLGYRTILGKNVEKVRGYLAGTDEERVEDIHQMFSDKNVKAIFCLRGGYGAVRLLDKINYRLIKYNPKIFVGFSEITSLQMSILKKTGLVTFAGPMIITNFSKHVSPFTEKNFWESISSIRKNIQLKLPVKYKPKRNSAVVTGRIVGGNLSVLNSLIGTNFLPDFNDKILFLEEISEPPYKIDRMLNQLRLNNIFKKVKGIILGSFEDCVEKDKTKRTLTLQQVFEDYFGKISIPVFHSFSHGHINDIFTFPYGIRVKLDTNKEEIIFLESGVK